MDLPADAQIANHHENGAPRMVVLREDATLDDIPCMAGPAVHLHDNGALAQIDVAKAFTIGRYELLRGDIVTFYADGTIESLQLATKRAIVGRSPVDGVSFNDDGEIDEVWNDGRTYDADGRLLRRRLHATEEINGIPCSARIGASFHRNGRLKMAALGGPVATPSGVVPRDSIVTFDDSGRMDTVTLSEDCALGGRPFRAGTFVRIGPEGPVAEASWTFYTAYEATAENAPAEP
jgi:hypothetical protein